jgi:hypothetical protein
MRNYLLSLELRSSSEVELYHLISRNRFTDECKAELARRGIPYKEAESA